MVACHGAGGTEAHSLDARGADCAGEDNIEELSQLIGQTNKLKDNKKKITVPRQTLWLEILDNQSHVSFRSLLVVPA